EGDDSLYGEDGSDILDGGAGNDRLQGGYGNDTYIFNVGSGQDIIYDYDSTSGNVDTVKFGEDILKMVFSQEGRNLKVSIDGTSDSLTIDSWYSGNAYKIEQFKASDESVINNNQVEQLIQAMAAFSTEKGMSWNQAIKDKPQEVQNILSQFWVHQDI
ncbi:MAG: calcium-binding protein, partial [Clostridiaceae bacterium]|nr:calcium-binding protein [Clostridiaceae bacterium]